MITLNSSIWCRRLQWIKLGNGRHFIILLSKNINTQYSDHWYDLYRWQNNQVSFLNLNCWISSERGANSLSYTSLNSSMKKIKCLKQVLRWYSRPNAMMIWKWVWYIWAYTRKSLLKMVFIMARKFLGNGTPGLKEIFYRFGMEIRFSCWIGFPPRSWAARYIRVLVLEVVFWHFVRQPTNIRTSDLHS